MSIHAIENLIERYAVSRSSAAHVLKALTNNIRTRTNCVFLCEGDRAPHRALYAVALYGNPCVLVYCEAAEVVITALPPRALFNQPLSEETQSKIRALMKLQPGVRPRARTAQEASQ